VIFGFNTDIKYSDTVYHVQSEAREHDSLLQTQVFVKGRCLGKYATSYEEQAGLPDFSEDVLHDLLKAQHKHFVECARAGTIEEEIESGRGVPAEAPPVVVPASYASASVPPAPDPLPAPAEPEEEQRISISLSDDPDLAAIAEASAAAIAESEQVAPPPRPMPVEEEEIEAPLEERPPDPVLDSFMAELEAAENEPPPPPLLQFRVEAAGAVIGKGIGLECLEPIVAPDGSSVLLNVQVSDDGNPSSDAQITCRVPMPKGPAAYVYSKSNADGVADLHIATHGLDPSTGILIQASVRGKSASRKFTLRRA
jgi:hypothetical protein